MTYATTGVLSKLVPRGSSGDIQLRQCDFNRVVFCLVYTTGGTGLGARCHFPFVYRGTTYSECTYSNANELWCSVTADYSQDEKWGYCRVEG